MTQGQPKIPPGVPAAVVGRVDHHDLSAHRRHPKAPFGDPAVGGASIDHHECTKVFFESVHKAEVGVRLAPASLLVVSRVSSRSCSCGSTGKKDRDGYHPHPAESRTKR